VSRAYVIANPRAGRGTAGEAWEDLLRALHGRGLDPVGDLTQHPGHATELAERARRDGRELVVAAGGDGTVHEVVNGLLAHGPGPDVPSLGLVPFGSGCDYVKTFGIPTDLEGAVARIASATPRVVDAGEITFDGGRRLFMNIAEVGIGPEVVDRAARLPRSLGGAVYFVAFWMTLPRFVRRRAVVTIDAETYEGPMMNLVVAIGQVFGGGMRVAPQADPSDGLFDVQVHHGSKPDYVMGIPKVYKGTHLPHPKIREARGATVEVSCDPPALVEADGEVLGRTPATLRVLPGALRVNA
jgi:YegS/Rv2252/BmrU family lipid kinase